MSNKDLFTFKYRCSLMDTDFLDGKQFDDACSFLITYIFLAVNTCMYLYDMYYVLLRIEIYAMCVYLCSFFIYDLCVCVCVCVCVLV